MILQASPTINLIPALLGKLDAEARVQRLAAFIDESEMDVLVHMDFPTWHRAEFHCTNPLERLNKEVRRRADVAGNFATRVQSSG